MKYLSLIISISICISLNINGQDNNDEPGREELSLGIKSISFIKNNEYFNPISSSKFVLPSTWPLFTDKSKWIEGYTLIGYFFQPELIYSPSQKITLRAGTHLLKYSGSERLSVKPVFSATLNISEKSSITLGSLSGADSHRQPDPQFNSERLYTAYLEDGLQFRSINNHIFNDTWLSWENYIFRGENERENFTFGESFKYSSGLIKGILSFEIPVQLQFRHFGGQISNYPGHVETFVNIATGLRINISPEEGKSGKFGLEYLQFGNSVIPERKYTILTGGNASWFRFHYNYKWLYVGSYYWRGHDFYSPNGNPVYASIMDFHTDYIIHERRVLSNCAFVTLLPEKYFELLFGIETYYDICLKELNHSMTLHFNFDKIFRLAQINKNDRGY